jgi:hypothetical protein
VCLPVPIIASSFNNPVYTLGADFRVKVEDHTTVARKKAQQSLAECKAAVGGDDASQSVQQQIDRMAVCMDKQLHAALDTTRDEIKFQQSVRKRLGQSWVKYACTDTSGSITTTVPIDNTTWTYTNPQKAQFVRSKMHEVNVLFESDFSKLVRVQDFISAEECQVLEKSAIPMDTNGGSNFSLPVAARRSNAVIDRVLTKLEALIKQLTEGQIEANMSNKDPMMELRIVVAPGESLEQECGVETDGSTCAAAVASVPGQEIRVDDPAQILASVMILCRAPDVGGHVYFPKTGTVLLPSDLVGHVVVALHQIDGMNEPDPFIDEYVICPVTKGMMMTATDHLRL